MRVAFIHFWSLRLPRVGGLVDVLDGADAELVPPDDAAALADAMETALERIELNLNYGARNRELAKRFSKTRMVDSYLAVYQDSARPVELLR